ncbi:MAG: formate dehydrogenase-N subunit alpha [Burkholderiales bacterium]|nr:formate dehydrogenase-N subunit alpha [Burkholderiales bacterium]
MADIIDVVSKRSEYKCSRLRTADIGSSICQYCAVGCSQLAFFKNGVLIDVEGDPRSSVNQGRLCPKGSSTYLLNESPERFTKPMYRAPGSDKWQEVTKEWILDAIAKRVWDSRAAGFAHKDANGEIVNQTTNIGFIGGSANDNEECYLFRKLLTGGLGILPVENSARYCHSTTVTALSPTFGYGACTNPPRDLMNSDCILIMGSNMAEAHPVAFYWPMQAKKKGAVTIHVDPRYTRTSAVCDHHVSIRPGTDIAFLGAIIKYIIDKELWFKEYVLYYTNAATLINEKFYFDENLGVFSGFDPTTNEYSQDLDSWEYQYEINPDGTPGKPKQDYSLEDPHCVFQLLKKQFEKYTPEICANICGCRPDDIVKVAELMALNSGKSKTTAFCYATGFTQHASGTQIIRTVAILQLLLGNIGRPGGGILALRGHSNVQGATDVPTLFNALPNYIPMPEANAGNATLKDYLTNGHGYSGARDKTKGMWQLETTRGAWASLPQYMVSLLKAWYGKSATPENEFGYQFLPKLSGDYSLTVTMERCMRGDVDGLMVFGQNIAVTNPNTGWSRDAIRKLKWLVVCDMFETETASLWYADPTGPKPQDCQTEVFFLPAASLLEKDGSATNTERLMQWHDRIKNSPGECHSDAWWIYQLGLRLKKMAEESNLDRDAPIRALTWSYETSPSKARPSWVNAIPGDPDMDRVALEMNGTTTDGKHIVQGSGELKADGSTLCGCRLLSGFIDVNGNNLMKRRDGSIAIHELDPLYRYAWPTNSRILYNRCSAAPDGHPGSDEKKLIWWDQEHKIWTGFDVPNFDVHKAPEYIPPPGAFGGAATSGTEPFTVHSDGRAWLFVPYGIKEGPFPTQYEPTESPYKNILFKQSLDPGTMIIKDPENPVAPQADPELPIAMTTYHLTEHWLSGAMTRRTPWLVELQPQTFLEISPENASEIGIQSGQYVTVKSDRTALQIKALVTPRVRIGKVEGRQAMIVGSYVSSGYKGLMTSAITNDLTAAVLSADGLIPASKGFSVNVSPGDAKDLEKLTDDKLTYPTSMTTWIPDIPWSSQPDGRD